MKQNRKANTTKLEEYGKKYIGKNLFEFRKDKTFSERTQISMKGHR